MIFLELEECLEAARRGIGAEPLVRDYGLIESALARPRTTVFGEDAYPRLVDKAAALLHSLARNHPLVDGNKRLALSAAIAFLGMNGYRLDLTNDEAYELVMDVAKGDADVPEIAERLRTVPRRAVPRQVEG